MENKKYILPKDITASELKAIRKKYNLTQKDFAKLVNCSKSTIERWEVSSTSISGPIVLAVKLLEEYPNYLDKVIIPEKICH